MCRSFTAAFVPVDAAVPRAARAFVRQALQSELTADLSPSMSLRESPVAGAETETDAATGATTGAEVVERVTLVVSELVSNAVRAGSTEVGLELLIDRRVIRIVVTDDGESLPVSRDAASTDLSGRGLAIVARISQSWGVTAVASGKQVWAEVASPTRLTHHSPCRRTAP